MSGPTTRAISQKPPRAYVEEGLRWPDGSVDEGAARRDGLLPAVLVMREAALTVRRLRASRSQDAIAARAGVYPETVGRLERGTAWLDVVSLTRILDAVDTELRIRPAR